MSDGRVTDPSLTHSASRMTTPEDALSEDRNPRQPGSGRQGPSVCCPSAAVIYIVDTRLVINLGDAGDFACSTLRVDAGGLADKEAAPVGVWGDFASNEPVMFRLERPHYGVRRR